MKAFPSIPRLENAPEELFRDGHLWIQEKVDGANVRFRVEPSGVIRFGGRNRVYDPGAVPDPYQHAVRHVRDRLDREALRSAVSDVESVVFFGEAMHKHTIEYDWERTPSFLGFDIWSAENERFLPPDAVEGIFTGLGLTPVNAIAKEVRAVDFDPDRYEIPSSNWYDGPAEGVIVRNKRGLRTKLLHPRYEEVDETVPVDAPADELARRYATEYRFEKLVAKLEDRERPVTVETLYDRAIEDVVREAHKEVFHGDQQVDLGEFRSTVAACTRRFLDDHDRRSRGESHDGDRLEGP